MIKKEKRSNQYTQRTTRRRNSNPSSFGALSQPPNLSRRKKRKKEHEKKISHHPSERELEKRKKLLPDTWILSSSSSSNTRTAAPVFDSPFPFPPFLFGAIFFLFYMSVSDVCDDKVRRRPKKNAKKKGRGLFSTVRFFFLLSLFLWGGGAWCRTKQTVRPPFAEARETQRPKRESERETTSKGERAVVFFSKKHHDTTSLTGKCALLRLRLRCRCCHLRVVVLLHHLLHKRRF